MGVRFCICLVMVTVMVIVWALSAGRHSQEYDPNISAECALLLPCASQRDARP